MVLFFPPAPIGTHKKRERISYTKRRKGRKKKKKKEEEYVRVAEVADLDDVPVADAAAEADEDEI